MVRPKSPPGSDDATARLPAGHPLIPYELPRAAAEFLTLHHTEEGLGDPARRIAAAHTEIAGTGTYRHTTEELVFGARVAWRNANRCIGRLYWHSLHVRDRRDVRDTRDVAGAAADHLREATRDGRIRALITVFAPDEPGRPGPRIWNEQLNRYAGYTGPDGAVTGDPRNAGLTALARRLGWPGGPGTPFDVLPLVIQGAEDKPRWFELPEDAVLEVELAHPEYPWWRALGLRWHAVPALANMCLEIGGICYPAAPFNGWYMGTEIGARNLADTDRYDLLPHIAKRLGLDTRTDRSLWKDRALVELNRSVLHSFDRAGVTVTDHHTESRRFLTHLGGNARAAGSARTGPGSCRPSRAAPPPPSTAPTRRSSGGARTSTTRRHMNAPVARSWSRPRIMDCYRRPRQRESERGPQWQTASGGNIGRSSARSRRQEASACSPRPWTRSAAP